MDLDQLAVEIDPDQARVAADVDLGADVAGRDGVEGPLELDVVIGVDGALGPGGPIEGLGRQRQERGLLLGLEHDARGAARGAVEAGAGQVAAPASRRGPACRRDRGRPRPGRNPGGRTGCPRSTFGFPVAWRGHGRVDEEAAVLRVLEEDPVDLGRVAIGARDDGLEIVDHEPADHALKEGPRRLQPREDRRQVLAEGDPQEGVPAEGQRDEESVARAGASRWRDPATGPTARSRLRRPRRAAARPPARSRAARRSRSGPGRGMGKGFEISPSAGGNLLGNHTLLPVFSATARAVARPPGPIRPGENIALRPPRTFLVPELSSGRSPSPRVGYCYTAPGGGHRDRTFTDWSTAVTGCTFWRRTGPRPVRSFLRRKNDGRGISGVRRDA